MSRPENMTPLTDEQRALAEQWYPLALSIAGHSWKHHPRLDFDAFRSTAIHALIRAARTFDPQLGFTFGTYLGVAAERHIRRTLLLERGRPDLAKGSYVADDDYGPEYEVDELAAVPDHRASSIADMEEMEAFEYRIAGLRPRQQHVLRSMILDGKSMTDIAKELGVSHQRVQQIVHATKVDLGAIARKPRKKKAA